MSDVQTEKHSPLDHLGDFTATPRTIIISLLAIGIGIIASYVAWVLLKLIALFTNVFYYGHWSTAASSPADNHLGVFSIAIPVIGSLIVGIMARYGSEKIRGHGIPEAIESILMNGSRVPPKLAVLKPVSAAISIGSGGPFGAEGPIIMTGGAFGSLIAQFFHLTAAERKTLLVAGAAAGMSATFAAPLAAILLAFELLLFEWKPRSIIPVALASVTAGAARRYILGLGPLFPVPAHPAFIGPEGLFGCLLMGLAAGALSTLLTLGVYAAEDLFHRLPIHWMWWPAIGGVFVGIGGFIFPHALGVGYDNIGLLLKGDATLTFIIGILLVKAVIWMISLGSGTSGGVLAPLLMTGAALGGLFSLFLPHFGGGFWPLVAMGAILAGTMRAPFTGAVFAVELTHDLNMLLPLVLASFLAHGFTVLILKRSILTEKIARRGYHLSAEYAVDALEILMVKEVMRNNVVALPASSMLEETRELLRPSKRPRGQNVFPVVDGDRQLIGVVSRNELLKRFDESGSRELTERLGDIVTHQVTVAYMDEPLRVVVNRMAETGYTRMPVVDSENRKCLLGMISLEDLLRARTRHLEEERHRERIIRIRLPLGKRGKTENMVPVDVKAE